MFGFKKNEMRKEERKQKKLGFKRQRKMELNIVKTIVAITTILMIAIATISSILLLNSRNKELNKENQVYDPEIARAMTYTRVQDGEQYVDGTDQNVQFIAFFLRDLDEDGEAEKYYGSCSEISKGEYLYLDINVRSGGTFKDGKITIDSKNFRFNGAFPKDDEIPNNTISSDLKEINFNEISNGMQKLLYGRIAARDFDNNTNLMTNNNNTVTLTGTYVNSEGEEIEINKTITLAVDWYSTTTTAFHESYKTYNDLNKRIDEENGKIDLSFTIRTKETKGSLLIKSNHVEGTIPQFNGYDPISVSLPAGRAIFNYNETTRVFTIDKEATVNAEGKITVPAFSTYFGYYPEHRGNEYTIKVEYPIEAYNTLENNSRFKLEIPVSEYYECFNNPNSEFDDLWRSNVAEITYTAEFYQYIERVYPESIDVGIGTRVNEPYYDYLIFKKKALRLYNGSTLPAKDDTYPVYWYYYSGTNGTDNNNIVLKETPNGEEQKSDVFVKTDETIDSIEEITTNIGVYFQASGPEGKFLNDEGEILIIDDETETILLTVNKDTIGRYTKNSFFRYDEPVKHVRVEISGVNPNAYVYVYSVKELDDDKIFEKYSRQDFLNISKVRTHLSGYSGERLINTRTKNALYPEQYSQAKISLTLPIISTQAPVENETVIIDALSDNEYINRVGWHSGNFLVKIPDEIISARLNDVTINNNQVRIISYELIENEQGKFFKIMTQNNKLDTQAFQISIDCDLTPDPAMATQSKPFTLYAFNDEGVVYIPEIEDIYDINNNGRTNEMVNKATCNMQFLSPNTIITNQTISDFDLENSVVVSPQIAAIAPSYVDIENQKKTARIGIQVKNNYTMDTSDFKILGKIPFEGNTDVLKGTDLGSEFTVTMDSSGIELPESLRNVAIVYYSENENPTRDVSVQSNGWMTADNVTDWTKVKTFLVDLGTTTIRPNEVVRIYYQIRMPRGVEMNSTSYSQHAVYFSLMTENGKLRTQIEPNKLGIRSAEKYNLNITKYQMHQNKLLSGATYLVQELNDDGSYGEAKTALSNDDGVLVFKNLFAEIRYELSEIRAPQGYDVTENKIVFIGHVDSEGILTMEYEGEVRDEFEVAPVRNEYDINEVSAHVEDEVLGKLQITKYRQNEDEKLKGARFIVTGKNMEEGKIIATNADGIATLDEITLGEEYTIEEIKAPEGYYLNNQIITFKMVNNHGIYSIETFDGTVKSREVVEEDLVPTLKIDLEDEKIPTYDLNILKVSKGDNTPLAGIKFNLYKEGKRIGTYISDENGQITITGLYQFEDRKNIDQTYVLKEAATIEGYAKVKDIEFTTKMVEDVLVLTCESNAVSENIGTNTQVNITIEDPKSFELTKYDGETGELLPNTKFAIYNVENGDGERTVPAIDAKGRRVGTPIEIDGKEYYYVQTDENGKLTANLPAGLYKAVEIEAADVKYDISNKSNSTVYFGIGVNGISGSVMFNNLLNVISYNKTDPVAKSRAILLDDGVALMYGKSSGSYIVKYNENDEIEWERQVYTGGHSMLYDICKAKDGGIITGGDFDRGTTFSGNETASGNPITIDSNMGALVFKYNSAGKLEWVRNIYGGQDSYIYSVITNDAEEVIVSGYRPGGNNFVSGITCTGTGNGFVVKYDKNGNPIFGTRVNDTVYSSVVIDDYIYAAGNNYIYKLSNEGRIIKTTYVYGTVNSIRQSSSGLIVGRASNVDFYNLDLEVVKRISLSSNCNFAYEFSPDEIMCLLNDGKIGLYNSLGVSQIPEIKPFNSAVYLDMDESGSVLVSGILNNRVAYVKTFATVPEQSEISVYNYRKEYKITTDVKELNGVKGGTISGEDLAPYETVKYGDNSQNTIQMIPNADYEITEITINGQNYNFVAGDDGSVTMPMFENMTEDKHVVVSYVLKDNKLTINKIDEETSEMLPGAKFWLEQIEERSEPENVKGELTNNSQDYYFIDDMDNDIENENLRDIIDNGQPNHVVDVIEEVDNCDLEDVIDNGDYYFVNDNGALIPTNGKTYQLANGGSGGKHGTTAHSYIPIDLAGLDGTYAIVVNAEVSSESSWDYGYATLTSSINAPSYDNTSGRFMLISGSQSAKDYTSELIEGGNTYYLHLGYRKDSSGESGSDQVKINSIKIYSATETNDSYSFIDDNGKYISSNEGKRLTVANSYIPIDLTGKTGKYELVVNAEVSSQSGYDYGYATVTTSTTPPAYNNSTGRFIYISGTQTANDYSYTLDAGNVYYLHFGYRKDDSIDSGEDKFTINSVNIYRKTLHQFYFEDNNGKLESNNIGRNSTVANSYIPIDLRGYEGKYTLTVNAEISSQSSYDIGYATIKTDTSRPSYSSSSGRFIYISGNQSAQDYQTVLTGGNLYYLHLGYYKDGSTNSGNDKFTINSINVTLNSSDLYKGELETNDNGQIITQIPFGKYKLVETHAPEGYELDNQERIIEFRSGDNEIHEFTIPNRTFAKIVVHHYLKDKNGNYTEIKVAEDEEQIGNTGDRYSTLPHVDLRKYELEKDVNGEYVMPDNYAGEFTREVKVINYYYEEIPTPLKVHYYLEGTYIEVPLADGTPAEDFVGGGYEGDSYTTSYLTNDEISDEYEFCEDLMPDNAEGTYGADPIEVTYYYRKIERNVKIVKHGEEDGEKLEGVEFDINGNKYYTDENGEINLKLEVGNYSIVETDTLSNYVLDETLHTLEVTRDTAEGSVMDIENEKTRGTVTVYHYVANTTTPIELEDGSLAEPEQQRDLVGEYYATKPRDDAHIKYEVVSDDVENGSGQFIDGNIDVFYYYNYKPAEVIVNHYIINPDGTKTEIPVPLNEPGKVAESQHIPGRVEEDYTTEALTSDELDNRYELVETPSNAEGKMELQPIEVNYYYGLKPAKVIVHHYQDLEETGGNIVVLSRDEEKDGRVGDDYETHPATDIPIKFEFNSQIPDKAEGQMTVEPIEVTYYYKTKKSKVTFRYIDIDSGEPVANPEEQHGKVDDSYRSDPKEVEGYTYVSVEGDPEGTLGLEEKEVIFYYKQKAKVTIMYIDKNTGEELNERLRIGVEPSQEDDEEEDFKDSTIVLDGNVGDKFDTTIKAFEGYKLIEMPEEVPEKMTKEEIVLVYKYVHVSEGLIERHIDTITKELIEPETLHEGDEGDPYKIDSKTFKDYDLVEEKIPENREGTFAKETITVTYEYIKKSKVIVKYVDAITGEDIFPEDPEDEIDGHQKDPYETEPRLKDGYVVEEIPDNSKGEMTDEEIVVVYKYKKISGGVVINHLDEADNKQLADEEKQEGYVGEDYKTKPKDIDKYVLVDEKYPENDEGKFEEDTIYVTYYYKKKAKVKVIYVDKNTNEEIEYISDGEKITTTEEADGYIGDEYSSDEKDIPGYVLIEVPDNKDGTLEEEETIVKYVYVREAKVITRYIDEDTEEEIEDREEQDGLEGDEYETEEKDIKYYNLVKIPKNKDGTMDVVVTHDEKTGEEIVDDITYVDYIYKKKEFNLKVDKKIKQLIVDYDALDINSNIGKYEIYRKDVGKKSVKLVYVITVTNDGELTGSADVVETIPPGMVIDEFSSRNWLQEDGKLVKNTRNIKPGETKQYEIILDWTNAVETLGTKVNVVTLENTKNEAGFEEIDLRDNTSKAEMVLIVGTGSARNQDLVEAIVLALLLFGIGVCSVYLVRNRHIW